MQRRRARYRQQKRPARRIFAALIACAVFVVAVYSISLAFRGEAQTSAAQSYAHSKPLQSQSVAAVTDVADPNASLQTFVDTLAAAKGGYAIAVIDVNGRHASVRGDESFTAASTYKLFVAYGVFKEVANGSLHWTDTVMPGQSAEECFRLMIVRSDNDCPEAFGNLIGWEKIDGMMDEIGMHNTQVEFHNNMTTANDLALYLSKLSSGTLLSQTDSQTLLGYMKQQIYRQGIPAGAGVPVADKPGFLGALLHDAGVVYGPKGPYVLVILSNNGSWSDVAGISKGVYNYLQQ